MSGRRTLQCLVSAAIVATAGFALANRGPKNPRDLEIPRHGWDCARSADTPAVRHQLAPGAPIRDFVARNGGHWEVSRNTITGSYHSVYGSGIDFSVPIRTRERAEEVARLFISAHPGIFASSNAELRTAHIRPGAGKWGVHFHQTVNGVRVVGGRTHAVMTESGRIFAFGADVYPDVDVSTTARMPRGEALAIAGKGVGYAPATDRILTRNW